MIGKLNDRILIQTPVRTPDGAGGFTNIWQDVKAVYADVSMSKGSRLLQYSQLREGKPFEILVREPVDYEIKPGDRILYKERELAFHSLWDFRIEEYSLILAFELI